MTRFTKAIRAVQLDLSLVLLGTAGLVFRNALDTNMGAYVGLDFGHYVAATRRWLETGSPYLPLELAGPFQYSDLTFIHPPIALVLFAPFLVLPALLFWILPIAGTLAVILSWRPSRWTWPVMALLLNWPHFAGALIVGNSNLWACFFIAAGLRLGWPILFLAVKPSLAPFVLAGLPGLFGRREGRVTLVRDRARSAAIVTIAMIVAAALLGGLWVEWLIVLDNSPGDLSYSIAAVPWISVPIVAWLGRTRPAEYAQPATTPVAPSVAMTHSLGQSDGSSRS
jgi:hypothetical protein